MQGNNKRYLLLSVLVPGVIGFASFHFPSGVQWRVVQVIFLCCFQMTCPIHFHHLLILMATCLQQQSIGCLEMVLGQNILNDFYRLFMWLTASGNHFLSLSNIQSHIAGWTMYSSIIWYIPPKWSPPWHGWQVCLSQRPLVLCQCLLVGSPKLYR